MAHLKNQTMPTAKAIRIIRDAQTHDEPGVKEAIDIVTVERCPKPIHLKALKLYGEERKARGLT